MLRPKVEVFERKGKGKDPVFVLGCGREGFRRSERLERRAEVDELVVVFSERVLLYLPMVTVTMLLLVKRAIERKEGSCEHGSAVIRDRKTHPASDEVSESSSW